MTNDLGHFLLATFCLFGGIATMLFLLAAIDPRTDRSGVAHRKPPRVVRPSPGDRRDAT